MKTSQPVFSVLLAMAGLAALTGCNSTPSSGTAANDKDNNIQMLRVLDTKVVGTPTWISEPDNAAIIAMNDGPLPAHYLVVGLDQNRQITAVLLATNYSSHNYQGFRVLSGNLGKNDRIALPGGEYEVAVGNDVRNYLIEQNTASATRAPVDNGNSALADQFNASQS